MIIKAKETGVNNSIMLNSEKKCERAGKSTNQLKARRLLTIFAEMFELKSTTRSPPV